MNARKFVVCLLATGLLIATFPPVGSMSAAEEVPMPTAATPEESAAVAEKPPMPPPAAPEESAAAAEKPPMPPPAAPATGIAAEVVETESGIYYTVKKGDTLWDLSRKFADSPYVWPDMWSDNSQIANPHRIYPGEQIRLYRREDVLRVQTEAPVVETAAVEEVAPPPEPPPALGPEVPEEEVKYVTYSRIDQVGFIRKPPVEPHGKIFSVRDNKEMISTDDIVYIRREGDRTLIPGNRYTIYRMPNKVFDKNTDQYLGYQHYLLGFVRIQRVEEKDYAVGKIDRAFLNIRVGDLLMPYQRRPVDLTRRRPPDDITGEIVMAEAGNLVIGDNVIAYINRGEKHGVQVGHVYNVFFQESGRLNPKSNRTISLDPVDFGEFIVLLTEDITSTVLITKAQRQIEPGTRFHAPPN